MPNKIDSLYVFLDTTNTKSFMLLKEEDCLEKYFNGHSDTSYWYWASVGKTLTSFITGIASRRLFKYLDTTSNYLDLAGLAAFQLMKKITIWNQLTMTSGLDDLVTDPFCTDDTCLNYLADAWTW